MVKRINLLKTLFTSGSIAFLTLFWAGVSPVLHAQTPELINNAEFRSDARTAVDSMYNFQFEGAQKVLRPWKNKYPGHPMWTLIEGVEVWWSVLSDLETTTRDEQFFNIMARADYESSRLLRENSRHADALLVKAISNGYMTRHYSNRGRWAPQMNRARKAYNAYQYLLELQPGSPDLLLAEGIKMYYSAHLRENYPLVNTVSWFLPEGDKQKGLEYMRMAADSAVFARAEAIYFLGNVHFNYEKNYGRAAGYFETLYEKYPNNNYYVRLLVKNYYRMKRYDDAMHVIGEAMHRWEDQGLPYLDVVTEELMTWKGKILYEKQDLPGKAAGAFEQAFKAGERLPKTEHRSLHAVSGYYLGRIMLGRGDREQAIFYLEHIRNSKADSEYRKRAGRLLNEIERN